LLHSDNENKTENPTENKIKKAQKRGSNSHSKELSSILVLGFSFFCLWFLREKIGLFIFNSMYYSLSFNSTITNININEYFFFKRFFDFFISILVLIMMGTVCITIFVPIFFGNFSLRFKPIVFNIQFLNIFLGIQNVFSTKTIVEIVKIISKFFSIFLTFGFYFFIHKNICSEFLCLSFYNPINSYLLVFGFIEVCISLCFLGFSLIVIVDCFWKNFNFYKSLRMSKEEVKEELKMLEGNPEIKKRIRRVMRAVMNRKFLDNVPNSDVLIVNPSHFSIAIKYDQNHMIAPIVLAKARGELALKLKKIAKKNNIPIFESPKLARILYYNSEIGKYVPLILYTVLAEILAWVWKLRKWKKEGGICPKKPSSLNIP